MKWTRPKNKRSAWGANLPSPTDPRIEQDDEEEGEEGGGGGCISDSDGRNHIGDDIDDNDEDDDDDDDDLVVGGDDNFWEFDQDPTAASTCRKVIGRSLLCGAWSR